MTRQNQLDYETSRPRGPARPAWVLAVTATLLAAPVLTALLALLALAWLAFRQGAR